MDSAVLSPIEELTENDVPLCFWYASVGVFLLRPSCAVLMLACRTAAVECLKART